MPEPSEICPACRAENHAECYGEGGFSANNGADICCCFGESAFLAVPSPTAGAKSPAEIREAISKRGGPTKDPSDYKDGRSAGRKQAAVLRPINPGDMCDWAGLKFAGGGVIPIIGCRGNTVSPVKIAAEALPHYPGHRHHGPDKNTLNNSPDNLSVVCTECHSRWHALNNPYYDSVRPEPGIEYLPLADYVGLDKETKATEQDHIWNDTYWNLTQRQRELVPYRKQES